MEEEIHVNTENFYISIYDPEIDSNGQVRAQIEAEHKDGLQPYQEKKKITARSVKQFAKQVVELNELDDESLVRELKKAVLMKKTEIRSIAREEEEKKKGKDPGVTEEEKMMMEVYKENGRSEIEELSDKFPKARSIADKSDYLFVGKGVVSLEEEGEEKAAELLGFDDFEGDPIAEAEKQLEEDPIGYYLDAFNKLHKGDHTLKVWELCSAISCVCSDRQINSWSVGPSGKGKSHIKRELLKFLPDESYEKITSLSPKALLYEAEQEGEDILNEKLVFFDEVENLEDVVVLLRSITDQDEEIVKHKMVRDQQVFVLKLKVDKIAVWFTSVETINDEQLKNRFILTNPDSSEELDEKVFEHQHELLHKGDNLSFVPKEAPVIQEMVRMIRDDTRRLTPIIPFEVEWKQKFNRRLYPYFVTLMELIAKINYKNREMRDGKIFVTRGDFEIAALIWDSLIDTTVAQTDQESLKLLKELPDNEMQAVTRSQLHDRLSGFSTNKVERKCELLEETEELQLINSKYEEGKYWYWAGNDRDLLVNNVPEININEDIVKKMLRGVDIEYDKELVAEVMSSDVPVHERLRERYERVKERQEVDIDQNNESIDLPDISEDEEKFLDKAREVDWEASLGNLDGMTTIENVYDLATSLEEKGVIRVNEDDNGSQMVEPTRIFDKLKEEGVIETTAPM